ncbi:hypothetical protein FHS29_004822 [Saccharothrix tamanrassetensis]|uniref:DUF1963 domain-containing protein n=1 Tax=Saccharothrix tamanrassetensis TaxID=1051531 RepID=A0A841CPC6_9PSEU|nr:hypothetical protein [Saccharothrix tamanrassetensis]MBB5958214.1 hypothetical protein [Saccharothrix tamanrassetensis]
MSTPLVRQSDITTYLVESTRDPVDAGSRDTIGGWPILPAGEPWPSCFCDERMVLFFQFDIPADIPAFGGDHLLVFQCPAHNDVAVLESSAEQLPERFWEQPPIWNHPGAFWRILLHRDDTGPTGTPEPYLQPRRLTLNPGAEELTIWWPERKLTDDQITDGQATDAAFTEHGTGLREFKIGGVPSWIQGRESYRCACGADLAYVCQLPENTGFDKNPGQPEQSDASDSDLYVLFLGNELYILACPAHCNPAAAWPVNHN